MTANLNFVTAEMLKSSTIGEWNEAVALARQSDPDFVIHLNSADLRDMDLSWRDFKNANFAYARLDGCNLKECNLEGANTYAASFSGANLMFANLTGVNLDEAYDVASANLEMCIGYRPPLPDVTKEVALHMFDEAVMDKSSFLYDGLDALTQQGVRWNFAGRRLYFWLTGEIERFIDPCVDGDCYCDVHHACDGCCDCCSCYIGECGCEPDHHNELQETGEVYLSSVIGHVQFDWSDRLQRISGSLNMSDQSQHPHISTAGSFCAGNAVVPNTIQPSDYLIMLLGWIGQHNPSSEYRYITDLPQIY